jgi:glycosyltransferase involved in cell wall biosynthesis
VPKANIDVIPNGIDTDYFGLFQGLRDPHTMVFHGNLGYPPNIDAAVMFGEQILPRVRQHVPEASFHVVGARPTARIRALAAQLDIRLSADLMDLRQAVGSAGVYVCAMRHGTGVKNKLLEAMALGVPIVCYPQAAQGINAIPGQDVLLADDPARFAEQVIELIRTPQRALSIARAARELVEQQYSWESRAVAFEDAYREAISAVRDLGLR